MPAVVNVTKDQILAEEEAIKEQVYGHFQRKIEETIAQCHKQSVI